MNAKQANRIRNGIHAATRVDPAYLGSWFSAYRGDDLWWRAYGRAEYGYNPHRKD